MQVKPRFHDFKILNSIDLLTDDFGNVFRLLTYEGFYMEKDENYNDIEMYERNTVVCAKNIYKWRNGATSFDGRMMWKPGHKANYSKQINSFTITEEMEAYGHSYCEGGIATILNVNV